MNKKYQVSYINAEEVGGYKDRLVTQEFECEQAAKVFIAIMGYHPFVKNVKLFECIEIPLDSKEEN